MRTLRHYAVASDCTVIPDGELSPEARAILERMARVAEQAMLPNFDQDIPF